MPTRQRYHIHVCLVRNEHPEFENALQTAFVDNYFLTWDLIAHPTNFMEYSRQQIDRCDYVLFVLGNGYGHLSPSGVSFLHLSYIYATTKRKPMLAFIKNSTAGVHFSRQRLDLASLIQKDLDEQVIYYNLTQEAITAGLIAFRQLTQQHPMAGWQRATSLHIPATDRVLQPKTMGLISDNNSHLVFNPSMSNPVSSVISTAPMNMESATRLEAFSLEDTVLVNYSAHAYQGGNLQDILATHTFRWAEIVDLLRQLHQPFSNDMMLKCLNDSLKIAALKEASKTLPNVHAVSRCQMSNTDFQWIKKQLIHHQWLIKDNSSRTNRELWRINPTI